MKRETTNRAVIFTNNKKVLQTIAKAIHHSPGKFIWEQRRGVFFATFLSAQNRKILLDNVFTFNFFISGGRVLRLLDNKEFRKRKRIFQSISCEAALVFYKIYVKVLEQNYRKYFASITKSSLEKCLSLFQKNI